MTRCLLHAAAFMAGVVLMAAMAPMSLAANGTVDDGRPVAEAILAIVAASGAPVTYEDPPYSYPAALEAMAGASKGDPELLVPKGGRFTFVMPAGETSAAAGDAVKAMVDRYDLTDGAATFTVIRDGVFTHVVPAKARDAGGQLRAVIPVLNSTISIEAAKRSGLEFLEAFCAAVSVASGEQVEIGTVPLAALAHANVTFGAKGASARGILQKLASAGSPPLAWRLLYDPGLKTYYLNLRISGTP